MKKARCSLCGVVKWLHAFQLCKPCYRDHPEVVRQHKAKRAAREPTAEELESLVAQQMANLPSWWNKEKLAEAGALPPREPKVYKLVKCT